MATSKKKTDGGQQRAEQVLERIAREHLFLETLETRGADRLDFHDLGVAGVKAALQAAFDAGRAAAS